MKKILVLIGCLLFLACGSKKPQPEIQKKVVDSVIVTKVVKVRDTVIIIPSSNASLKIPVSELTQTPVVKKSGQASVSLKKESDTIIAEADCKQLELRLKLKDSLIKILKARKEIIPQSVPCDEGNWYDGILKTLGFIFLAILAVFSIWLLIKYFTR